MVPVAVALLAGVLDPPLHPAIINNVRNIPIAAIICFPINNSFSAVVFSRLLNVIVYK